MTEGVAQTRLVIVPTQAVLELHDVLHRAVVALDLSLRHRDDMERLACESSLVQLILRLVRQLALKGRRVRCRTVGVADDLNGNLL